MSSRAGATASASPAAMVLSRVDVLGGGCDWSCVTLGEPSSAASVKARKVIAVSSRSLSEFLSLRHAPRLLEVPPAMQPKKHQHVVQSIRNDREKRRRDDNVRIERGRQSLDVRDRLRLMSRESLDDIPGDAARGGHRVGCGAPFRGIGWIESRDEQAAEEPAERR